MPAVILADMKTVRRLRVKIITWSPPGLPLRGIALLAGPLSWEAEVDPETGRPETARLAVRLPDRSVSLNLVPRISAEVCRRDR
jgi:hypothetical protein